eukprot:TRINITY_DN4062_c0_g1_i1.p1 TRINITY_DN4062_c0_g1~~TRINITY_DN4062_c0_g1_i1.p1  ORF type:complete len:116 (-),score=17.00 TRINITY_DN4062_c0_g1_i1:20-367(-)
MDNTLSLYQPRLLLLNKNNKQIMQEESTSKVHYFNYLQMNNARKNKKKVSKREVVSDKRSASKGRWQLELEKERSFNLENMPEENQLQRKESVQQLKKSFKRKIDILETIQEEEE